LCQINKRAYPQCGRQDKGQVVTSYRSIKKIDELLDVFGLTKSLLSVETIVDKGNLLIFYSFNCLVIPKKGPKHVIVEGIKNFKNDLTNLMLIILK
jgi:hypothetical protein